MARATNVGAYKNVWQSLGNETYRVDDTERIETVLEDGELIGQLPPRYAALYKDNVYVLLSVQNNNAIVAAFETPTVPTDVSYASYSVNDHCRDRMVQRNITTGTLRGMFEEYVLVDRLSQHKYKLICTTDGEWYRAIVDVENAVIETVWPN